jgi:hypothetical protein
MRQSIFDLSGGRAVLSGTSNGRQLLSALIANTPAKDSPEVIYLDFDQIEIATSSFLREGIVGFRNFARSSMQTLYPVLANASLETLEELEFYLKQTNDSMWHCKMDSSGLPKRVILLGELEPSLRETLDLVMASGATTAPLLSARPSERNIGVTAWNNRLSALSTKGILIERREGKTKKYSPVLETL